MSILDVTVSCFKNYRTPGDPKEINLLKWLNSDKYMQAVLYIRTLGDKDERNRLKADLPCITPSGLFSNRCKQGLIRPSSIICLDIDKKENQHISNFDSLIIELRKILNLAYCGLSVSGEGWFLLLPIESPNQHEKHFEALSLELWHRWSIRIDKSCRDVSRLRGYSYDPDAYFNHDAIPHKLTKYLPCKTNSIQHPRQKTLSQPAEKVYRLVETIVNHRLDITSSYQAWFEIGCSLANELGENGRRLFHDLSQFHPDYSAKKCDRQFNRCLNGRYPYTIGTFYLYCNASGVQG